MSLPTIHETPSIADDAKNTSENTGVSTGTYTGVYIVRYLPGGRIVRVPDDLTLMRVPVVGNKGEYVNTIYKLLRTHAYVYSIWTAPGVNVDATFREGIAASNTPLYPDDMVFSSADVYEAYIDFLLAIYVTTTTGVHKH